jgi:hypothetical protein
MKKTSALILRNSLLLLATLFTISNFSATAQTKPAAARITQAIDEAQLAPMHTKVHPLARAEFDRGVVADSMPMDRMLLILKRTPEQEKALRNLMDAQQTKNSPNYHAWLTPAQFGQQFGVADADVQKVTAWLAQNGFTKIKAGPENMLIEFSGTAGLVRSAFHTEIHNFMVKGEAHTANVSVPQMPAALAPVVTGIHSLHNFRKQSYMHYSQALANAKAQGKLKPGFGNGTGLFALAPGDFATIYNLPPTTGAGALNGTGQTIAIVARSNIAVSDINQFGTGFGIPNLTNFTATNNIILASSDPGVLPPDDGEATLDVEWSGAVAPNAKILLVVSDGTVTTQSDGVDLSAIYIVENNLAPIMNESFGLCEAFADDAFENAIWEEAAAQGITVMVSAGDNGSAGCDPDLDPNASTDGLAVSGTASTPFNIAVGGTDFDDATNQTAFWNDTAALQTARSYIPEIPWNDTCASAATIGGVTGFCATVNQKGLDLVAGSGGPSTCGIQDVNFNCLSGYPKPVWQTGTGVPADGVRDVPDVSLFASVNSASKNFYIMCLADSESQNGQPCNLTGSGTGFNFTGVGGTSASSPAFAGIIALVNQSEVAANRLKAGEGQGNVNYVLYKLAALQATSPGTGACNSSLGPGSISPNCTFNDVTKGNNSVACDVAQVGTAQCSAGANATGILVENPVPPYTANAPGWAATAGYDMATGLGSVNVTNLVGNWGSVTSNFIGSTTTITAPAAGTVNISHGANVNFTASVAQNTGAAVPTGDVSLTATPTTGPQVNVAGGTLGASGAAAGTVLLPTNFLPGGTYPVVAHYAGNGTFAASDSAPFSVTVSKENSTTQTTMILQAPPNGSLLTVTTAPYGSLYLFRTDVLGTQNGDNQVCATVAIPCPTGTITLTDGGAPLNDFLNTATGIPTNVATLNVLGFVEDRLLSNTGLIPGAHNIGASYSGDISYNASVAPALPITITAASTSTGVTANGSSAITVPIQQSVTLVANITGFYTLSTGSFASNGAGPTGSVTFSTCGTASSCTVTVVPAAFNNATGASASATATLTTKFASVGVQTISATFTSGDTNYTGSASSGTGNATVTVTAAGTPVKLAFTVQPSNVTTGASIAPAVQVTVEDSSGNIVSTATNAITIAIQTNPSGGTLSGTKTVNAVNGVATFSNLSINNAGVGYTLTASATGLTPATSNPFNVTTTVGPPAKLAFAVQPSNVVSGASIAPAVQVAVQDASGNLVTTATKAITMAIGTNPGGGTLSGTTTANAVNGVATFFTLSINNLGTGYTLTASATGLTSATSSAFNVTLGPPAKLAFTVQPSNVVAGASIAPAVQVTVRDVSGNLATTATNAITIAIGTNPGSGTLSGTATANAVAGVATFSNLSINTAGTGYTLTAAAAGLTSATSSAFNVTPAGGGTFTVSYSPQPLILSSTTGAASTLTVTVTPSGGFTGMVAVTPTAASLPPGVTCTPSPLNINVTGAVAVTGQLMCSVTATSTALTASNAREGRMLDAKVVHPTTGGKGWWTLSAGTGFAALFLLFLPGGRKKYRAALGLGLVCILGLTAGCNGAGGGVVPPPPTATVTKLTVASAKVISPATFSFSVAVTGGTPTGMVQLFDGATMIGTAATVTGGVATPTAPALAVGTHAITAHYLGDARTAASASGTLNLTVTGGTTIAITSSPLATPVAPAINVTIQ